MLEEALYTHEETAALKQLTALSVFGTEDGLGAALSTLCHALDRLDGRRRVLIC